LCADGFTSRFHLVTPQGEATSLTVEQISPSGSFAGTEDGIVFVGETTTRLPELYWRGESGVVEQLTRFNQDWEQVPLVQPEIFAYPSFDGTAIEAALLKPRGSEGGSRLPLVALIHGGPSGRWSDRFESWGQLLAARGWAVFYPNVRGSIGSGHGFLVMNRRDWGGGDFSDIMAGLDYLIQTGVADPDRIGIGGWSYGGYMAAWAVTQTDRFKASISGAPMTDLAFEYGTETSSINAYDTWYLGTPYENLDLFVERSPTTHLRRVSTPTLLLCAENDVIDPIGQCRQFHRGLKRFGVETEFVRYPREGHGIREEMHQIDLLNRVIDWFERYLK
jgi:dipeptidyl aminopeptidase/acylaminoacyl peptidase